MLKSFKLLLPVLIPSWRFFDEIAPSPRIEYAVIISRDNAQQNWQEFRRRPAYLPASALMGHLFWNARWNESLFLVSLAERLINEEEEFASAEIVRRLGREIEQGVTLKFRLVFYHRVEEGVQKEIMYLSSVHRLDGSEAL